MALLIHMLKALHVGPNTIKQTLLLLLKQQGKNLQFCLCVIGKFHLL